MDSRVRGNNGWEIFMNKITSIKKQWAKTFFKNHFFGNMADICFSPVF
ncbi:hypothetical protein OMAG_002491 [Candidatus Omnitrophus magneticus]|uniref:Uncharacterized protein n=1 Tax=Candidatus Omnitrophus magneticus TaxID=1609969 RepID=A0A0F0CK59_9BACT|nr:hypothetical protein OMAG_002491 [Candidatus Omnitrophus magneticus]